MNNKNFYACLNTKHTVQLHTKPHLWIMNRVAKTISRIVFRLFFKPKKKHRKKVYQENSFNLVCVHHSPKDYCTVQFILPSVHFPFSHPLSIPFLLYPTLSPPYPSNLFPNPYPSPLSVYNPTHFLHLSTIKPLPPFLTLTMEIYIPNCH